MTDYDSMVERWSRRLAKTTGRRSVLRALGTLLVGAAALPLLPISRVSAASVKEEGDSATCEYWRYCALGGTLCACCGGTYNSCPPGSEPSPVTWIGTCRNPVDDRDYLISYNDCCGKATCERCECHNTERERPVYYAAKSASVLWCFGTESRAYHCTIGVVLGVANEEK